MWFVTIAWKNLRHRKIRSALTCLGMAVSVCAVVVLIGISQGYEQAVAGMFEKRGVDIVICRARTPQHVVGTLPERFVHSLRKVEGVLAAEPILVDVVSFEESNLVAVYIVGWVPGGMMFDDLRLTAGRTLGAGDQHAVLLGKTLARSLEKEVGDRLEIGDVSFVVTGIYESFNIFEDGTAIVPLPVLQEMMDRRGEATLFAVRLRPSDKDPAAVESLCGRLESLRDERGRALGISAMSTQDHVKSNLEFKIMKGLTWSMSAVALLVGCIGILNTMMIAVFERTREIGTLAAVGWGRRQIANLILLEALLLTSIGAVLGIAASFALMALMHSLEFLSTMVPRSAEPAVVLLAALVALVAGLVGAIVPAWRACSLLAAEALRHE